MGPNEGDTGATDPARLGELMNELGVEHEANPLVSRMMTMQRTEAENRQVAARRARHKRERQNRKRGRR